MTKACLLQNGWSSRSDDKPLEHKSFDDAERLPNATLKPIVRRDSEAKSLISRSGGIGRRAGFKIPYPLRVCGFESHLRHFFLLLNRTVLT